MRSNAKLRRKVPHAGIGIRPVIAQGRVRNAPRTMGGPPNAGYLWFVHITPPAPCIHGRESPRPRKIPAQNRRRNAHAGKRPANRKRSRAGSLLDAARAGDRHAILSQRRRRIRLPKRKHLDPVLKISLQRPVAHSCPSTPCPRARPTMKKREVATRSESRQTRPASARQN